jgi:hypothetical protein
VTQNLGVKSFQRLFQIERTQKMFRFLSNSSSTLASKRTAAFQSVKQHARIKYDKPYGAPILHLTAPLLHVTAPSVGGTVPFIDWTAIKDEVKTNVHFRAVDATENLCFALTTMEDMDDDLLWSKYGNLHFRNGVGKHLLQVTNTSAPPDLFASVNVDAVSKDVQPPPPKYSLYNFSWNEAIETVSLAAIIIFSIYMYNK